MTALHDLPFSAQSGVIDVPFDAVRLKLLELAGSFDLAVKEQHQPRTTTVLTVSGGICIAASQTGVRLQIASETAQNLQELRESVVQLIAAMSAKAAEALRWSDAPDTARHPSTLHRAQVVSVTSLGSTFLRVVLRCETFEAFSDTSIHFRLVLPPTAEAPLTLPTVAQNGVLTWPKGDQAPHRPVYTVRALDRPQGLLTFDVFRHAASRTEHWADHAQRDDVVFFTGPSGGGIPDALNLNLFADETGLPAVARFLENLPSEAKGRVFLKADVQTQATYPMPDHAGFVVEWVPLTEGALSDAARDCQARNPDHFLWFAAGSSEVDLLRKSVKSRFPSGTPGASYIVAFWSPKGR